MDGEVNISPFLSGGFAPIRSEQDLELEVVGEIPAGLRGVLYRIGPNPQFQPMEPYHLFVGDGMIHAFAIADGKVTYRNRYVRTPRWELEHEHGRALFGAFGDPTTVDPIAMSTDSGLANTNIFFHAGRLLALEEGHPPFEVAPRTLESMGYANEYLGRVTAHPKINPKTGETAWFAYGVGETPLSAGMSYGTTDASGRVIRRQEFEAPFSAMVHDFMVTENYVLFPLSPLTGSIERAMKGLPAYAWEPEKGSRLGVMRRDADVSTLRWFDVDTCFVFHPMNAWEADGKICADVMQYEFAPLFPNPDGSPRGNTASRLVRWTLDLSGDTNAVKQQPLDDLDGEFPRLDERYAGLGYRHGWYAADPRGAKTVEMTAIAHIDFKTGKRQVYELPAGDVTSEPVFSPRAADAAEGDGWITAVIWRAAEDRSDLLIFEAQDLAKGPIATARLPSRVPYGIHGNWVAD